jgi:hypothetical protein
MKEHEGVMHLPQNIQSTAISGEPLREVALHEKVTVMVVDIWDLITFERQLSAQDFATMVRPAAMRGACESTNEEDTTQLSAHTPNPCLLRRVLRHWWRVADQVAVRWL